MKAWLVEQQSTGAVQRTLLDPFRQTLLALGRSSQCDVVVDDQRASRHHSDIRWTGRQWEISDRGSTNGTYVNGARIQGPAALSLGDRVSIGDTTMMLREYVPPTAGQPAARAMPAAAEKHDPSRGMAHSRDPAAEPVMFWLAQALIAISVICLVAGAFMPWFRVTGSLPSGMEPLFQGLAEVISSLVGEDLLSVTQDVQGFQGFGKFSIGLGLVCAVLLVADLFVLRRSSLPGVIYLLAGLGAMGIMVTDLLSLRDMMDQVQSMTLLFGIELADVVEAFGQFIEMEIRVLAGTYLTLLGLGCLLLGGIVRFGASLANRRQRE